MTAAFQRLRRLGCIAVLAFAFAGRVAASPAAAQESHQPLILGVCTHFGQGVPDPDANFALIAQAGIGAIRDEVYWSALERRQDQLAMPPAYDAYVDAAVAHGIAPLLILDYGNALYDHGGEPRSDAAIAAFTRYAVFVARHFQAKVRDYEVWNEWDNSGGNTDDYARLLKSVYPALKAVDPGITVLADAVVLGRGRDSDFQKMHELGLLHLADGISIHPYTGTPEQSALTLKKVESALRRANKGRIVPLYATEIGWPTYSQGVSLSRAAAYAARFVLLAHTMPFLRGMWWYDFRNDGQSPNTAYPNYGLVWPDLSPKPAYYAVGDVAAALSGADFVARVSTGSDDDWLLQFRSANGREIWALWSDEAGVLVRLRLTTMRPSGAVETREVGHRPVKRQWITDSTRNGASHLDITAGETPVLVTGNFAQVTVDPVEHLAFPDDRR